MTEEIKEEKKCQCCISPEYKQFLLTILAAFLGCLVALCLYSAAVKPKMPTPPPYGFGGPCPIHKMQMHHPRFERGFDGPHKFKHKQFKNREVKPIKIDK